MSETYTHFLTMNRQMKVVIEPLDTERVDVHAVWTNWDYWLEPPWHHRIKHAERKEESLSKLPELRSVLEIVVRVCSIESYGDDSRAKADNGWTVNSAHCSFTIPHALLADLMHVIAGASELNTQPALWFIKKYQRKERG